jgi:hypothetical protein
MPAGLHRTAIVTVQHGQYLPRMSMQPICDQHSTADSLFEHEHVWSRVANSAANEPN